ncbi:MAG TPA: HAMP domain-containing sensor histidine kinase [Longimicrobium sp.]|nr:HAMP domain-containing sensor histidine kinase [Longimicrobium sp.]
MTRRRGAFRALRVRAWRWMPAAVLVLALGVAAAAVFEARRASVRDHDATRDLVKGHGAFAAFTFARHVETRLGDAFRRAEADGRSLFTVPLDGGATAASGNQTTALEAVRRHARESHQPGWDFAAVPSGGDLLVYSVLPAGSGRVARGFVLSPAEHTRIFREIVEREPLLPTSLSGGRRGAELVLVRVLAPDGRVLFASPGDDWQAGSTETLGPRFGGMRVYASIQQAAAFDQILGGRTRSLLPLLAGLLALAAVTGAVAIALLRREGELARVRSDFVSSVSHELRTPLAQMRLFVETLRLGRYRTDQQRDWILSNVERETFRLATLVENILHFSRAERGALPGSREPVELGPWLAALADEFAPLAASRKATIETVVEPGTHVLLHTDSFRQVMLNLLDNAVKYGPAGQTVRLTAVRGDGTVRIAVEDEGPGVDPRERAAIWEPFRRGQRAIGSVAAGSGIGLSVVREIVEWHGGTARVESAAGGGARFVVELPAASAAQPTSAEMRMVG